MDVILLASYVLVIKVLCFVCKGVFTRGKLDRAIVILRRTPPPDKNGGGAESMGRGDNLPMVVRLPTFMRRET
jgi:hypothetical protein